jgi:hypothetical protein
MQQRGWRIQHIKYLGRNFFVVMFEECNDKELAESNTPWFLNRRYMFTFPWHPAFNVHTEFLVHAPVWIELQFRDLIFEPQRSKLVEQLGPILHYTKGDEWSTYPHDRVCVMWDMRRVVPKYIKIVHSSITLWQPIEFKTLPLTCFICRADSHLAHNCPRCPIKVEALLSDPIQKVDMKRNKGESEAQKIENKNEDTTNIKELSKILTGEAESSRQKELDFNQSRNMEVDNQRKRGLESPATR